MNVDVRPARAKVICSSAATEEFDRLLGRAYRLRGQHSARHMLIAYNDTLDMLAKHPDAGEMDKAKMGWRRIPMPSAPVWIFYSVWSDSITIERLAPITQGITHD